MFKYRVFKTESKCYLYDGTTGNIFEIDELFYNNHVEIFRALTDNEGYNKLEKSLKEKVEELRDAVSNSVMAEVPQHSGKYWFDEEEYFKTLSSDMCQLMIGITERCNMRCKYCIYSGHYENERKHSERNISSDKLKKAIDYFYSISKNKNKIFNFYGGEPFVKFDAIKGSVDYINSIDSSARFYITTNGTLLSDDIITWFSNNKNVTLYVSLAGTPQTHDELRVFKNELPTFSIIKNNIMKLKKTDFDSFAKRVHFIFNIFDDAQLFEIQKFWEEDDMFKGNEFLPEITYIDCYGDDGTIALLQEKIISKHNNQIAPLEAYIEKVKNNDMNNIISAHFDNKFMRIHRRNDAVDNVFSGVCRPFAKKMFVDVEGNVHMCENFVNGKEFGTINDNFDTEKIKSLLSKYKVARGDTCSKCWASKLCSLCYRDIIDRNGDVNETRGKALCHNERMAILSLLEQYCKVMENGSEFLDHLDKYEIFN